MRILFYTVLAFVSTFGLRGFAAPEHRPAVVATAQVPLSFEQVTSGNTRWAARGSEYRLAIGAGDVEVAVGNECLRIRFVGADTNASSIGLDALPGKLNYFIGRNPKLWRHDIPTFGQVRYSSVYPGTDVVWYGNQGRLEYDLVLDPGADAGRVAMRFEGARKVSLNPDGDLRVDMAGGSLTLKKPEIYQQAHGGRQSVSGGYELRSGNEAVFNLGPYDSSRPLIIDPTLIYASYFGSGYPQIQAVTVDGSGNVYIGGHTGNTIPLAGAEQSYVGGAETAFVSKFDPTGTTVLYSTYVGGSLLDELNGIAVDSNGNLIGTGWTESVDFPAVNAVQSTYGGNRDAFAFKLNPAGNALVYSTYLGGAYEESGRAVAVDSGGSAYFTGYTIRGFPATAGALNGGNTFVVKLSMTGARVYSAVLGASRGEAIAADGQGAAYVAGYSTLTAFPNSPPGAQTINAGSGDAFAAKLSSDATTLVWATFLGGSGDDSATAIALGNGGVVYFGGKTSSPDLPVTAGVIQGTYGGGTDGFVASVSADGSSFGFVTYLGGGRQETLTSLAAGSSTLVVAGNTYSRDFPVSAALQPALPGPPYGFSSSTNFGGSFSAADGGLPIFKNGGTILPDPSTAGTLLVDTGQGVFRSTNDGATWVNVEPNSVGSTARSLSNPSVLYTADFCSLYKSSDGGQTWSTSNTLCAVYAYVVGVSPTDSNTVLAFNGSTEYRSTDGGTTFSQITAPMYLYPWNSGRLVASPDGSMYAVIENSNGGIYKSTDAGLTWSQLSNGAPLSIRGFAVSTANPSTLFASDGSNVYESTDAGASWMILASGVGINQIAVAPSNAQVVYGTGSNGVLLSTDGGVTWNAAAGAADICPLSIVVSPGSSAEVYLISSVPSSGFLTKVTTDGRTLLWSTYYGSHDASTITGVALAPSGDVWAAGTTASGSLPITTNARDGNTAGSGKGFVARIADSTASCAYTVSPAGWYAYSAGQVPLSVTAPSGCSWNAAPSDAWIHVIRTSGTGSGTIPITVDANTTAGTRTGTVSVGGQVYSIVEPSSSCTYQLSQPSLTSAGGTATITVTAAAGCPWNAQLLNSDPASFTSATTGSGNGTVTISAPANSGINSNSYTVQIGNASVIIPEAGTCTYTLPNGTAIYLPADAAQYSIAVNCNMNNCAWNASSDQAWLTLNNGNSSGSGTLNYTVSLNNTGADRIGHINIGGQQITISQAFTSAQFNDVAPSIGYFDAVNLMFQAGVTTGCVVSNSPSTRSFCPNDNVTREEMAAFIVRAVTGTTNPANYNPTPYFTDVPPSNPFFPHIQKMMDLGITTGCAPNLFCPTDTIPRWQMAIFMVRARLLLYGASFSYNPAPYFADAPTNVEGNGIAFPFIQRSYEENITAGCATSPLQYCPDEIVTRWQMASFIMRALFNETMSLPPTAPLLTGASPNTMAATPGAQLTVTITGLNTNFTSGDTVAVPSGMLTVSNVVVNSATSITATLTAAGNIAAGPQALVVTTGGQNLTWPLAIKVGTY